MSVNFKTAVPEIFTIPEPISTSKSILRKGYVTIPANENSTFNPNGGTTAITFNISSPNEIFIGSESYMRFTLQRTTSSAALDGYLSFDEGGAHSIIRRIEVNAVSLGVQIGKSDEYHRKYCIDSKIKQSPEQVEQFGHLYGDAVFPFETERISGGHTWTSLQQGVGTLELSVAGVLTGTATFFTQQCKVGDMVRVVQATTGLVAEGRVLSITSNTVLTINWAGKEFAAATTVAAYVLHSHVNKASRVLPSYSDPAVGREYCIQLNNSALLQNLPLLVMRGGITVTIHLELPQNCLVIENYNSTTHTAVVASDMGYQIKTPVFMAMMVTPHQDIRDEYIAQYNSKEGLLYYVPQYRYVRSTSSNTDALSNSSVQHGIGARGCRRFYAVQQDADLCNGTSSLSWRHRKLSTFHRYGLTGFYVQAGALLMPQRAVKCDEYGSREAYQQLLQVAQTSKVRFTPTEWQTHANNAVSISNTAKSNATESAFIMAVDLSRDNGGNAVLTGTDLSSVALDVKREGSVTPASFGFTGSCNIHMFIEYDAYLKISSDNVVVMS